QSAERVACPQPVPLPARIVDLCRHAGSWLDVLPDAPVGADSAESHPRIEDDMPAGPDIPAIEGKEHPRPEIAIARHADWPLAACVRHVLHGGTIAAPASRHELGR